MESLRNAFLLSTLHRLTGELQSADQSQKFIEALDFRLLSLLYN